MSALTAKVFRAGDSKVLRLPKSLKVKAKTVFITPTDGGFVVTYPVAAARRRQLLHKLWGSCPSFPSRAPS